MNLCDKQHAEVCYTGRDCPACEKIDEANEKIGDLERKVSALQDEIASMET